jgi:hypothetical protein
LTIIAMQSIYKISSKNGDDVMVCDLCGDQFQSKDLVLNHKRRNHFYQCDQCAQNCVNVEDFIQHEKIHLTDVPDNSHFYCSYNHHGVRCDRPYQDAISLQEHRRRVHFIEYFECPFDNCSDSKHDDAHDLFTHVVRSHIYHLIYQDNYTNVEQNMFGCPFCSETFLWVGLLFSSHLQKHIMGKVTHRNFEYIEDIVFGANEGDQSSLSYLEDSIKEDVKLEIIEDELNSFEGIYIRGSKNLLSMKNFILF